MAAHKVAALLACSFLLCIIPTRGDEGWDDNDDFEDIDYGATSRCYSVV